MMRSPRHFAVACRAPNGEIVLEAEALEKTWIGRQKWLKLPFFRGSLALLDSMALGVKAMRFASEVQMDERYQPRPEANEEELAGKVVSPGPSKRVQDIAIGATIVTSLAMGLFIFNYLPNLIAQQARSMGASGTGINLITELTKMVFFFAYVWGIGFVKGIHEVFQYHGAEHKAINTLEADQPLTIENCLKQTRLHPRCGTSFAVVVLLVSMPIMTFVPRYWLFPETAPTVLIVTTRFLTELLILPLIAGTAYELIRLAGRFKRSNVVKWVFYPGLMTQYLTTREPNPDQVEVALTALKACVEAETGEGKSSVEAPEGGVFGVESPVA